MDRRRTPAWYLALLVVALVMALALSLVSVHIRLLNSGLGCADWPECYGRIGVPSAQHAAGGVGSPERDASAATRAHRIIASTLGLMILAVAAAAVARRPRLTGWLTPMLLLGVMIALAVLGNWSSGLQRPGVVMANFTGGIALAGLIWWLLVGIVARPLQPQGAAPALRGWATVAIVVLAAQILLGGLVSAYFAGLACGPSPHCDGNWMPALPWHTLSGMFGVLELDSTGRVIAGDGLAGLHMAHRLLGMALVPIVGWLAWLLHRHGHRALAGMTVAMVVIEAALGVASVQLSLHPGLVLSHYALALALLLALLVPLHPAAGRADRAASPIGGSHYRQKSFNI